MSTVRVSEETHRKLQEISEQRGQSMTELLAETVKRLEYEEILRRGNESYAAVRKDPEAWEDLMRERAEWDATLLDGLEDE